jgi:hypothetical protein
MPTIEQAEIEAEHQHLVSDVESLVEKYRSIFDWNVPDIDQPRADKLIVDDIRKAIDGIEQQWCGALSVGRAIV